MIAFFERLAAAMNATLNSETLEITHDPDTLLLAEFIMNTDETVIDFTETRGIRVYGGKAMRRLERRVTKFQGNHVSWTPVISAANCLVASLLVFKHSSPTKASEIVTAEAEALKAAVATYEESDRDQHSQEILEADLLSALADGGVLEPSISQSSLITDREMGELIDLPFQLYMATATAWSNTGTFARLMQEIGESVRATRARLAKAAREAKDEARALKIEDPNKCPAVLIMDNLGIHCTEIARRIAEQNGIRLVFLPSGLTDQMQVLDTHVFAAFKRQLRASVRSFQRALHRINARRIRKLLVKYQGAPVPEKEKPPRVNLDESLAPAIVYEACHGAILNSTNASKGFEDNGQFPLDPTKLVSPADWIHLQKKKVLPTHADRMVSPILQLARREIGAQAEEGVDVLSAEDIIR